MANKILEFTRDLSFVIKDRAKIDLFKRVFAGFKLYTRIRRKYPSAEILIYDYSGIGDVYVFCLYLKTNYNIIYNGDFVIVIPSNTLKRVFDIFGLSNYIVLNKRDEIFNLTLFSLAAPSLTGSRNITPFPRFNHTDISFRFGGVFFNMGDLYKYQMFKLPEDASVQYPVFRPNKNEIKRVFLDSGLTLGRTAILSPYAKTCIGFDEVFWLKLAIELEKRGFTVCTNVAGTESAIPKTIPIFFRLEDAEEAVERAGLFIGIRSGLCDVICNADCKKIILYPDYRMFNSSMYDFCSFEKMRIGRNITEISSPPGKGTTLLPEVLKHIDHDKQ